MALSVFNVYVEGFPAAGQTLVYNTFSGASVVIEDASLEALRGGADAATVAPGLTDLDVGVVVESRAAEEAEFNGWLRSVKDDKGTLSALVSTSYACNLACTYCVQEKIMNGRTMSLETAERTADFLAERVRDQRPERVELCFVGGEPLLHPDRIERVAARLRPACDEVGADFGFQIITNATLMTPALVERLKAVGLRMVQVSLDGDECSHGITRVDKKGRNTFRQTWARVLEALPLIPIAIQGNYTEANLHGFLPLLERLKRDGVDPARVPRIKFKPALDGLGAPDDAGYDSCTWSNARPEVQLALIDAVRAFGYTPHDPLELGPCAIHQKNHFTIGPEGLVWKCPGFLGKAEWATGSVETGLTRRHAQLTALASTRECGGCTFRPSCGGGCIAVQWVAAAAPEGVNCERAYFDTVGVDAIKREYLLATLEPDEALRAIAALPGGLVLPRPPISAIAATSAPVPSDRLVSIRLPRKAA